MSQPLELILMVLLQNFLPVKLLSIIVSLGIILMMVMIHIIKKEIKFIFAFPCWNNNSSQIFTGKYDYDNKWALDKYMRTVQYFMN